MGIWGQIVPKVKPFVSDKRTRPWAGNYTKGDTMKNLLMLLLLGGTGCATKNPYQTLTQYGPGEGLHSYKINKDIECYIVVTEEEAVSMDCVNNRQYELNHKVTVRTGGVK